jgi:sarcosine oxidase/L-pipecolate oxidase
MNASSEQLYDVIVIGGGPVGLNAAYEVAKAGKTVAVLEKRNFFNQAGSSGDMARMYRTMSVTDFHRYRDSDD